MQNSHYKVIENFFIFHIQLHQIEKLIKNYEEETKRFKHSKYSWNQRANFMKLIQRIMLRLQLVCTFIFFVWNSIKFIKFMNP